MLHSAVIPFRHLRSPSLKESEGLDKMLTSFPTNPSLVKCFPTLSIREKRSLLHSQGGRNSLSLWKTPLSWRVRLSLSLKEGDTPYPCGRPPLSWRVRLSLSLKESEGLDGSVYYVSLAALRVTAEGRNP